jgi:hypothetical protein
LAVVGSPFSRVKIIGTKTLVGKVGITITWVAVALAASCANSNYGPAIHIDVDTAVSTFVSCVLDVEFIFKAS